MKIIKKIFSLVLALLLVVNFAPANEVSAATNYGIETIASDFMNIVSEAPNDYGINIISDKFRLSTAITPYKYNEDGLLEVMLDTKYYFIYSDNEPIAALISNDDVSSVYFEADLAKELKGFERDSFTIVCDEQGAHINSTIYDSNPKKTSIISLSNNTLTKNAADSSKLTASSVPASYGLSIPIILQGNDNDCWAACVAAAGKYLKVTTKTARQVCDAMGIGYNSGALPSQIVDACKKVYSLNNSYLAGGIYNLTTIYSILSSNVVPLAIFYSNIWDSSTSNDMAHNVVIQGYQASTQGAFLRVMDPNNSSYCMIFSAADPSGISTFSFSYGTNVFYWEDTVLAY